jgi:hypothetical protein
MGKVVENLRGNISFSFVGGVFMYNIIIVVQDEEESDLVFPNMQVSKQST